MEEARTAIKTKTIPLVCYTCGNKFGKVIFSGAGNVEDITKLSSVVHDDRDYPYDLKFFCCENCVGHLKQEGIVRV